MKLTFNGASKFVTGSCYRLETGKSKFLIDCGMFQGKDNQDSRNMKFNFDPKELDFVLLTHAHIDHSGLLPRLYRLGFKGKIYCTRETRELIEVLLLDSAKIQEDSMKRASISGIKVDFLYSTDDAYSAIDNIETVDFNDWKHINDLRVKFIKAGHILGAASILINVEGKNILFSGDLGRKDQSLIDSYERDLSDEIDYIVMESLYGGQHHKSRLEAANELVDIVNDITNRNGIVIIPTFAVHRAQELMMLFKKYLKDNKIHNDVQFFLDGPLSIKSTEIYTKNFSGNFSDKFLIQNDDVASTSGIFAYDNLRYIYDNKVSLRLMRKKKIVIMAGSGMCDGGRIINHLTKGLNRSDVGITFVGFQAEGTLGREIVEGSKSVQIYDKEYDVKSRIYDIKGFSAHAGHEDLIDWVSIKNTSKLKQIFLVHAEEERSLAFKSELDKMNLVSSIPDLHSNFSL